MKRTSNSPVIFSLSAINSGVKDVREVIEKASLLKEQGETLPVLFIDEIHRFSKSQQDSLLGAVERGIPREPRERLRRPVDSA